MRPSTFWRTGVTVAAGGLLLMPWASPLAADLGSRNIQVLDVHWLADLLQVTLQNRGNAGVSGRVVVEVEIRGERLLVHLPFSVTGGAGATIRWVPPAPVEQIHRVGIIVDDGTPF